MNDNSTPTGVANPNRTRIRTEADLRRGAQPANPDTEPGDR
ncbi:hypothetical protein [Amycolatopsis plumensis]|uniref:Uncharacterized protein n=1 Tax=Amycolatopsis plumensis TaxID=236508 RepID=A0ABV5TX71_9PSEU